ncbi:MAG TPA: L-serine ammonia-lyase, iron-sulfur-dependent, subunit alpha [Candidatus Scatomorpha intestinavium]|uniref:L-serine dehydratase n=1 Tax=Candidatus Scatomorpha intestinavium TaxID=2840922 RepID=A0A9D1CTN9_9FIRM|nr:L-serine ammonia-lyase, iron-sulfur-dependent, subunit alpha [Candidatus Scatomorpha intestinavium]
MLEYRSISELCGRAEEENRRISELVLADQAAQLELPAEELFRRMERRIEVMESAVAAGLDPELRSASGLTGGDAAKMWAYAAGGGVCGGTVCRAIARAIAVSENNAAMGRVVAAPTAGSCGILPGTVVSLLSEGRCSREAAVMSLFTAGAFGMVIAARATIAGAEGGCQAECGSAAAMAAAAVVELMGGSPGQCADACAMAIKNQLGLVCDPVAGLVEIPCIKRNAAGVTTAFCAAEMALAGIRSKIPADECIDAMRAVGESMPSALRETARGGLAATPTGERLREQVFGVSK